MGGGILQIEIKLIAGLVFLSVMVLMAWMLRNKIRRSNEMIGYDFDGEKIEPDRRAE